MVIKLFKNLHNIIDFFFRKNIKIIRNYNGKNEDKSGLFSGLSSEKELYELEKNYFSNFKLDYLKSHSTKRLYLENIAMIELLKKYLETYIKKDNIAILDIGSKNWFYAFGEHQFFKYSNLKKSINLKGVEIDAFRLYSNFHSRYDYAQYHIKNLDDTGYLAIDLLKHNDKYDFITWFFPFLTELPLLEWGLPLSSFKPAEMLLHSYKLLKPEGVMLIVNQDEKEYKIQQKLCQDLKIEALHMGEFESSFIDYGHKRFVSLIIKKV